MFTNDFQLKILLGKLATKNYAFKGLIQQKSCLWFNLMIATAGVAKMNKYSGYREWHRFKKQILYRNKWLSTGSVTITICFFLVWN